MRDEAHGLGAGHQGRDPRRGGIGVLGWALLALLVVALLTLWPG
ncbi:hypothetical protein [Streptomyces sp. NPDC017988]